MSIPDFFTRADFPEVASEAAAGIAEAAAEGGINLGDIDGIFKFVDKFEGNITRIVAQIIKLRGVPAEPPGGTTFQPDTGITTEWDNGHVGPTPAPDFGERPREPIKDQSGITAEKIFTVAMGALNDLDDAVTVGEVKANALKYKAVVIVTIQEALEGMGAAPADPLCPLCESNDHSKINCPTLKKPRKSRAKANAAA